MTHLGKTVTMGRRHSLRLARKLRSQSLSVLSGVSDEKPNTLHEGMAKAEEYINDLNISAVSLRLQVQEILLFSGSKDTIYEVCSLYNRDFHALIEEHEYDFVNLI